MTDQRFENFLSSVPQLHTWDRGKTWKSGGFNARLLRSIRTGIEASIPHDNLCIAETGAGNSTILFLLMQPKRLVSIAPDEELRDRILTYCAEKKIDSSPLEFISAFSEVALPRFAERLRKDGQKLDVALIDGGHGWPTDFVDFCYFNLALRKGGLLIVDDLQIYAVNEFARWLYMQKQFSLVKDMQKTLIFRKEVEADYMGDHGAQPYIVQRKKQRGDGPGRFEFREQPK
ncbi:MAG TPA: class I SAM-dependent methyltransferase [Tepidisphaeraceae bacterium]|nr:class I SAM-dependent methyltransferase [Tepidisphaeraceae bacterium]